MICQLFKQLPEKYRQLYEDPVISSCLFRSLDQFQQQLIFRFITQGGQIKNRQLNERVINPNNEDAKLSLKSATDKFEELGIIKYVNEQKSHKLSSHFSASLEKFIYGFKLPKQCDLILTEEEQTSVVENESLLNLLYDSTLRDFLKYCDLSYIDLKQSEGALNKKVFNYIRATNAQRIGILVRGFLKYKNKVQILKEVLYLSLLSPNQIYKITEKQQSIISQLHKLRLVKKLRNNYFLISRNLHHFAFDQKNNQQTSDLKCKVIIQTNFKVYVELKSHDQKAYAILKSIMKELLELEHSEYDFEELIVGSITEYKMGTLFDRGITSTQYFQFFRQFMDQNLSIEKDLGKWKKLKFLGLEGPSNQSQIPNNVKQQVKLWEKLKKQSLNYQIQNLNYQSNSD